MCVWESKRERFPFQDNNKRKRANLLQGSLKKGQSKTGTSTCTNCHFSTVLELALFELDTTRSCHHIRSGLHSTCYRLVQSQLPNSDSSNGEISYVRRQMAPVRASGTDFNSFLPLPPHINAFSSFSRCGMPKVLSLTWKLGQATMVEPHQRQIGMCHCE